MNVTLVVNGSAVTLSTDEFAALVASVSPKFADVASARALDTFYTLMGAFLVFFMQVGFCFLEVGCVHVKNTKNILVKNILDGCISAVCFYFVGYAFGFVKGDGFIGNSGFVFLDEVYDGDDATRRYNGKAYAGWLFQWAFAATASTIVTGAVAERISFVAYIAYAVALTAFIYPVVVHWVWSSTGFASAFNTPNHLLLDVGAVDFAGSGVVHMTGGMAALVGCCILGPRLGRFEDGQVHDMPKQSVLLQTIGTLLLWFGWYGFNCMSTGTLVGNGADVAAKVAVNLTLAAAAAGISCVCINAVTGDRIVDPTMANNGVLSGAVAITAGCAVVEPAGAVVIGLVAAVLYTASSRLLVRWRIDDVVDAVPVHLLCGMWGVLAPGLLASSDGMQMAYGRSDTCGLFYTCAHSGRQFAAQLIVIVAIVAWVGVTCTVLFLGLFRLDLLRVTRENELAGLDVSYHGGLAYDASDDYKTAITKAEHIINDETEFVPVSTPGHV
ncbi:hypothetical protein H257_11208 [Aphanomyces astaci]|uniref:Ammonium transporter n=1 Tax=Aphanomyces astaci TaxID=112090 RepID=W4G3J5_APHAT|nr:hypothetical protein H257_11208 [Aphanomyces astaci]ETV74282.1 hypothetical protein H257_11208 [Aphanomyces astaci]RQM23835.1 hypothetical protein B5M09_003746 [Aphanomyces astaci]|eukprot:XP_009836388.1 hypothetical protein H257_11208 [Aphanomyces astaci]